jgi:hypothetical protein
MSVIDPCGICLDEDAHDINVKLEPCNHIFHKHCITDLYKFNILPTCPYCRSNIIDIIEQNTHNSLFLDILSINTVSSTENYFNLYNQYFQEEMQEELDLNEMLLELLTEDILEDIPEEIYEPEDVPEIYVDDFEIYETTINEIYYDDEFEFSSNEDTDSDTDTEM